MTCPVCGQEECARHDSVVSFTHFLDLFTVIALAALGGVLAMALALATA